MVIGDFDKIWCLTCCDADRLKRVSKEFEKFNLNVVYSYNPINPVIQQCPKDNFQDDINVKINLHGNIDVEKTANGLCACFMGHFNIIKASYLLGLNKIIVFEDDIKFAEGVDFNNVLEKIPEDFDVVNLYYHPENDDSDYFVKASSSTFIRSTVAQAFSRNFMEYYLSKYENKPIVADYFYDDIDYEKYNVYLSSHEIVECYNSQSSIIVCNNNEKH